MQRRWWILMAVVAGLALFGCGGGGDAGEESAETAASGTESGGETADPAEEPAVESALAGVGTYHTEHDPDAVYTYDDIPGRGNYVRVNFEGLSDAQVNRVVHRLRTEQCHCLDCKKDELTIDECLIGRTTCSTSEKMATAIVSEEKRRED
jgi:hypothetical protein